jgi:enamine deaminase RidA (YjgF/YER057c/UK114 family)
LILDLLDWIGPESRPYPEVIDAWRTSCPRLPVWEEANEHGFLEYRDEPGRGMSVSVSERGRAHLRVARPDASRGAPPEPPKDGTKGASSVRLAVPFFMVTDMEASLRFYVDGLGFAVTNQWTPAGRIEWCWLRLGDVALMLQEYRKDKRPAGPLGHGVSICLMCSNALAIYRDLTSKGVDVRQRPFVGNGLWVTSVQDPDGYRLDFESPTEAAEETVDEGQGRYNRRLVMSGITRTNPPALAAPTGYTHVVEVAGPSKIVYIAGQVAFDVQRQVVGRGDMKAQTEQVYRNLEAALAAAGASFKDVVKMTTYLTDMAQAQVTREARARYFGDTLPASTLVQVVALAHPDLMIEIEVVAALGG